MVLGKPSKINPLAQSGSFNLSFISSKTISSETRFPDFIISLTLSPISLPFSISERIAAPVEIVGIFNLS